MRRWDGLWAIGASTRESPSQWHGTGSVEAGRVIGLELLRRSSRRFVGISVLVRASRRIHDWSRLMNGYASALFTATVNEAHAERSDSVRPSVPFSESHLTNARASFHFDTPPCSAVRMSMIGR